MQNIALAAAGVERHAGKRLPLRIYRCVLCEFIRACYLAAAGLFREPAEECVALARRSRQGAYRAVGRDIGVGLGAAASVGVEPHRQQARTAAGLVGYVPYLRDVCDDILLRAALCRVVALRKLYALCGRAGVCAVERVGRSVVICQQDRMGDAAVIDLNALGMLVQHGQQRGLFLGCAHVRIACHAHIHAHVRVVISHARAVYPCDRAQGRFRYRFPLRVSVDDRAAAHHHDRRGERALAACALLEENVVVIYRFGQRAYRHCRQHCQHQREHQQHAKYTFFHSSFVFPS